MICNTAVWSNFERSQSFSPHSFPSLSGVQPIRGSALSASEHFSQSLFRTTWRDRNEVGATHFHVRIYLAIDHDVPLFAPAATKPATSYFPKGFRVLSCTHTPFL